MNDKRVRSTVERFFAGEGLGLGNPLTVNSPPLEEPVDFSNRGPRPKRVPRKSMNDGEKGKSPTISADSKSPSEEVAPTPEGGDLKDNPFNAGKKPSKLNRKREGNPAEQTAPGFNENLWVPAATTSEAFAEWYRNTYGALWRYHERGAEHQ
jgi:hypothetical protein